MLSCVEVDEASQLHLYPNQGRHDHLFIKEADCQVITISIQTILDLILGGTTLIVIRIMLISLKIIRAL